jgi:hopanoid-associated phosphorylase
MPLQQPFLCVRGHLPRRCDRIFSRGEDHVSQPVLSVRPSEETTIAAVMCLAFEARIAAAPGVTVICNGRRERLHDQVRRACARAAGLISFGVAGGLDPARRPGDWIVASSIVTEAGRYATDERWSRQLHAALPGACSADIFGLDVPVASPAAKLALGRAHGAAAVDTESHVVAAEATRHGIPFVAARVVLDAAWRALPPAALVPLRSDGDPDIVGIARAVLGAPSQLIDLGKVTADAIRAWSALRRGRLCVGPLFAFPGAAGAPETAAAAITDEAAAALPAALAAEA